MSIPTTALRIADSLADMAGLLRRPLGVDGLVEIAQRHTGLTDFGETAFIDPLRRFLVSCMDESSLGIVGRLATRWDVVRFLSNLLRLQAAERANPGIVRQELDRPIFITGLPRSGTTFLHRLMMLDPVNRAPLVWQTIYPYPDGDTVRDGPTARAARVDKQLRTFEWLAPEFRALHPLDAASPQECSEITAHVFRSLRFDTNYHIPSYRAWLDEHEEQHLPAYRFHKRFLQHLQHQDGPGDRRWVLKCPEHVFALPAIRAVYPDARLIFVHRDPVKVLASVAKLTEVLRRPFTRQLDRREIGRDESTRWLDGARRMMVTGNDAGLPDRVCHVHHMDLVKDPVVTIDSVYRHFGLTLDAATAGVISRRVADQPNGGYGRHHYRFEDHGLDPDAEREKFQPYMAAFGIQAETGAGRRTVTAAAA